MARLDYPWHIPDIKFGQNLVVNVILLIFILGFYAITGLVALIILVVDLIKSAKSKKDSSKPIAEQPKLQVSRDSASHHRNEAFSPTNQACDIYTNRENRNWLVLADDEMCDYERAFDEHGYVYLNTKNRKFQKYDTVYLYMATKKKVRYETLVVEVDVPRGDEKYWITTPSKGLTCKLQRVAEYKGRELTKSKLKIYGFKGENSIRLPICNNRELMEYIEDTFLEYSLR